MLLLLTISFLCTVILVFSYIENKNLTAPIVISFSINLLLYSFLYFFSLTFKINSYLLIICLLFFSGFLLIVNRMKITQKVNFNINYISISSIIIVMIIVYKYFLRASKWGQWDAWAIWNLHAKFFYYDENWHQLFTNKIAWSHPDYPLFQPLLIALIWKSIGSINYLVPIIFNLIPLIGVVIILNKSVNSKVIGIVLLLFIMFDSKLIGFFATQYADGFVAFYYLLTISLLVDLIRTKFENKINVYLLGIIAAASIWIKNEGMIFFIITCTIIFIFNDYKLFLRFLIGALPVLLIFMFFKYVFAPPNDIISGQSTKTIDKILDYNRYLLILKYFWNIVWNNFPSIILFVLLIIFTPLKKRLNYSFLVIVLSLVVYLSIYIITPHDLKWHLETSLDRLIFQLYPSFLFISFKLLT